MIEPLLGDAPLVAGYISIGLMLVLLFAGVPIAICMGFAGVLGIFLITGAGGLFFNICTIGFEKVYAITLLAIPLFIFMGAIISRHEVGADIYDATYKWAGRLPGGLAVASVIMGALFGFMSGSAAAGAATIGGVALPEMEKKQYDRKFSCGSLALGGTLAVLIPPSSLMIIYAVQTEVSMGRLFFAGIFPGLLLMTLASLYIIIRASLQPKIAPKGDKFTMREKWFSIRHLVPVLILFVAVLGSIYFGVASPIEAGAVGAFVATLICLGLRRLTWKKFTDAASDAAIISVMIFILIIGAALLSQMFFVTGLRAVITEAIAGWEVAPWLVIVFFLAILTIMGMFIDVIGMLLISLPIMFPVVIELGLDPIWFGIIMIVSSEMALITPPVGVNLFVIQGIAPKGTTLGDVAIGSAPFVVVLWIFLLILIFFPDIAMWLPSTMIAAY